jgi:hypothetical protein
MTSQERINQNNQLINYFTEAYKSNMVKLSESRNRINIPPEQFLNNLKVGEHGCVFFHPKGKCKGFTLLLLNQGLRVIGGCLCYSYRIN